MLILFILALLLSLPLIAKAGGVFVDSARAIAEKLGISQAAIGLTLVAFATSAPELATSLIAAFLGNPGIAYGNIVGSNIANIALILALAAILGAVSISRERIADAVIMFAVGGMLAGMSLAGTIGRFEGLILLLAFGLFLGFIWRREAGGRGVARSRAGLGRDALLFTLGAAGVIIGGWLLVSSGVGIAQAIGVDERAIGFSLVAFGTSVPELVTVIVAAWKRLPEISAGTVVGSNVFNTALILGLAALVRPIPTDAQTLWFSNPMMLASMAVLLIFMWTGQELSRREGFGLLAFYAAYLIGLAQWYKPIP